MKEENQELRAKCFALLGHYKDKQGRWVERKTGYYAQYAFEHFHPERDLNDCAALIASLTEQERVRFWGHIGKMLLGRAADRRLCQCYFEKIAEATARQRCEAFILTHEQ